MTIPEFQKIMHPLLDLLKDNEEHSIKDIITSISSIFKLTKKEREKTVKRDDQPIINNRVGWARTYMKKAGLLNDPRRGYVKITERGLKVIESNPRKIDIAFLKKFKEFREFQERKYSSTKSNKKGKKIIKRVNDDILDKIESDFKYSM